MIDPDFHDGHPRAHAASSERVAIVHDYLTQYGGAEKVVEQLVAIWPRAQVFTTFFEARLMANLGFTVAPSAVRTVLPAWLPHRGRARKLWTMLYPFRWRLLDLHAFDLVISSTSFAAHQVRVRPDATHISYCHTPPRFLYGLTTEIDHDRVRRALPALGPAYRLLRAMDQQAAGRVTAYAANSREVQARIARCYGRSATVIYPPVDTRLFADGTPHDGGYFLTWGRLVASKRTDLIVQAANAARVPLIVAGSGPEEARLRAMAGPNIRFTGRPDAARLVDLLRGCRAAVFAGVEDFGIVQVEAMAAGKPLIAYGAGGALETVIPGETGELFTPQTAAALSEILADWHCGVYDPVRCRAHAATFDAALFRARMLAFVDHSRMGTIASEPLIG